MNQLPLGSIPFVVKVEKAKNQVMHHQCAFEIQVLEMSGATCKFVCILHLTRNTWCSPLFQP